PCPSIFARQKPLVEATLRRIARGLDKFVIRAKKPFIVPIGYGEKQGQKPRLHDIDAPFVEQANFDNTPISAAEPLSTATGVNKHRFVTPKLSPFIEQAFGGTYAGNGANADCPLPTVTATDHNR